MSQHQPHPSQLRERLQLAVEHRCILVTGAGGAAGRALVEQLVARGLEVHCADSQPMSDPTVAFHLMPDPANPSFLPALARIVQRYGIDLVIPASSDSLPVISVGRLSLGVDVVVPGPGPTGTAHDRLLTAWSLWSHGVAVPDFGVPSDFADAHSALDVMGGQLTLRSRWASGARVATVINASDVLDWSAMSDDWFVQRFVPGLAYSVVVYRPLDGKGRLTTVLEESVQEGETSTVTRVREGDAVGVEGVAQAAVRALGLTGPLEVGIRCGADGLPVVLDVKACFGPHSGLVPEVLDAVLRDHPASTPTGVNRDTTDGMAPGSPGGLRNRAARRGGSAMSWVPGRGRPVAMPHDRTPLRGRSVDPQARIAWLLRLSRLATAPGPAGQFLEMLRAQGCNLGPSTLCRYETGAERVPLSVIRAYEATLGLPAGHLVGVVCGVDRMFGPALAAEATAAPMSRARLSEALGDWETRVPAGAMRGTDWIRVADVITLPTGPVLPPSVLNGWVDQLLSEAMRSVHHALTTRMHAIGLLMADRDASRILVDSVERVSSEQGARGSTGLVAILGNSPDPAVIRWLVGLFERSEGDQQWGAAYGLLNSICRGTLPGDLVPAVTRAVMDAASDGMDRGRPAFMLAQRMSAALTQQVVARLGQYPAPTAAGARVQSPAALSSYRVAALRESGLDDPMLDRLLREALSPDFVERQHHSLLMLAASPYRDVLADVAVQQMSDPTEPYAAQAAAHVLIYLARPEQRQQLVELMVTSGNRFSLLQALAHAGGVPDEVDLAALADDPALAPAAVFAAGMSNHPDLQWFQTNPSLAGSEVQCTAAWWGRTGPVITDVAPGTQSDRLDLAG